MRHTTRSGCLTKGNGIDGPGSTSEVLVLLRRPDVIERAPVLDYPRLGAPLSLLGGAELRDAELRDNEAGDPGLRIARGGHPAPVDARTAAVAPDRYSDRPFLGAEQPQQRLGAAGLRRGHRRGDPRRVARNQNLPPTSSN